MQTDKEEIETVPELTSNMKLSVGRPGLPALLDTASGVDEVRVERDEPGHVPGSLSTRQPLDDVRIAVEVDSADQGNVPHRTRRPRSGRAACRSAASVPIRRRTPARRARLSNPTGNGWRSGSTTAHAIPKELSRHANWQAAVDRLLQ